jgi:hypothetical protein
VQLNFALLAPTNADEKPNTVTNNDRTANRIICAPNVDLPGDLRLDVWSGHVLPLTWA